MKSHFILILIACAVTTLVQANTTASPNPANEQKIHELTNALSLIISGSYVKYVSVSDEVKATTDSIKHLKKEDKTKEDKVKDNIIIPCRDIIVKHLSGVAAEVTHDVIIIHESGYNYSIDKLLKELIISCELHSNEATKKLKSHYVSIISNHLVIKELYLRYERIADNSFRLLNSVKEENMSIIKEYLSRLEDEKYISYRTIGTKKQPICEFVFAHPNDFLAPFGRNQDRELTGALDIRFGTNYLTRENLSIANILTSEDKPYLSYQSVGIKAFAYTPYIRYRDQKAIADTLFQSDRPFSNIVLFSHQTYRIWPRGIYSDNAEIALGLIGSDVPKNVQALLHRDANIEAQLVYGWDTQVANGGRYFLQLNYSANVLLYSNINRYGSVFSRRYNSPKNRLLPLNVIVSPFLNYGGYKTSTGFDLSLSTLDLVSRSGMNGVSNHSNSDIRRKWQASAEIGMRYEFVVHNSTLEGFGYMRTYRDDAYDDDVTSIYTLNQHYYEDFEEINSESESYKYPFYIDKPDDEVNRHLNNFYFQLQARRGKATVFWRVDWIEKEYRTLGKKSSEFNYQSQTLYDLLQGDNKTSAKEYYDTKVEDEQIPFDGWTWYPIGTIGVAIQL